MRAAILAPLMVVALATTGCRTNAVHDDRPARIVNPTERSRAELRRVVSDMLFGADVVLADDALTESSVLVVERSRIRSLGNPPLSGRDLGKPERFHLVTAATGCVLIHENDQARYELRETDCAAE